MIAPRRLSALRQSFYMSALMLMAASGLASAQTPNAAGKAHRVTQYAVAPLRFEPNQGQAAKHVRYVGRTAGFKVELEAGKITFAVPVKTRREGPSQIVNIPMTLLGGRADAEIAAFDQLPGRSNYLLGPDPRSRITGLPNFAGIRYAGVYPGTDLVFHGDANRLEYDFNLAPGANPSAIAWRLGRHAHAQVRAGELWIESAGMRLRFLKPVAFQEHEGTRQPVRSEYRLQRDEGGTTVSFFVGPYDSKRALVIDPVLEYSTPLSSLYNVTAMTTDGAGNVYVANDSGPLEIVKLAPDGKTLIYNSTIGTTYASASALAVDASGQVYVTGEAYPGYATTSNSYQPTSGSGSHAFLTVVNATGSGLVYSSYLQGSSTDRGTGIALDPSGKVLLSGWTYSYDFPDTNNVGPSSVQRAFVAKFDPALSGNASLLYSAILGGNSGARAVAVRSDAAGNAYTAITGYALTYTAGAYVYDGMNTYYGVSVAKLDSAGAVQYVSYLGYATAYDLAVDDAGNAYITGSVYNGDFPATAGAYQTSYPNAFLAKLNPAGSALVFSTYLGGPSGDLTPTSVALPSGCTTNCTAVVSGTTYATDFPVMNAIQNQLAGSDDAFIVRLSADGSTADFSTYFGGSSDDNVFSNAESHIPQVSLDSAGNMYLAGNTYSSDFPFTNPGSTSYPFVAKINATTGAIIVPDQSSLSFSAQTVQVQSDAQTLKLRNYGSSAVTISSLTSSDPAFQQTNDCGGSIAAGGSCSVQVRFTGAVPGTTAANLSIANSGTPASVVVPMTGYASDQALLRLSPAAAMDFSGQAVNTSSAAQTFTITNVGTQPATVYSIYASASEFSVTSDCPALLAAGASCSVAVAFTPYNVGQYYSYVYISASATVTPSSSIAVKGTGTGLGPESVTPSTTSLSFSDQLLATVSSNQNVTIQNTGTTPVTIGPASASGDFSVSNDGCNANSYDPGGSCTISVVFTPTATGTRTGTLTVGNTAGASVTVSLSGIGVTGVPALVFSPQGLVFSNQVVGTQSDYAVITLTNTGNEPITINRVYDSGTDFRITSNGCSLIYPYSQCSVYVAFTPKSAGNLSGTVTFIDTASGSPHVVSVSGTGVAATQSVIATPASATFNDTVVGSDSGTQTFYFYNSGNTAVSASAPISSSADFVIGYSACSTISPTYACGVDVEFRPQSAGPKTGTITLNYAAAGSPAVVNVSGNGITATNSLVPNTLNAGFPDTVVGQTSSQQTIYIYNPGNTNVTVSSVSTSGDFAVAYNGCSTAYATSYCYVNLQFAPTAAGARTGTLTLFDNAPGNPHTVSLSGNGVNPVSALIVTPASLGFDDQVVGATTTSNVTLFNPGNVTVTVASATGSGDFATTGGCSSIAPGSSCSLGISFTPTAAGARTGTITLTDSAPGSPHGIAVYGNGLDATTTVAITPASLDFGSVVTSTSAPAQAVIIQNTGTMNISISSVAASSPFTASGCITTLSPRGSCTLNVSVNTGSAGATAGTLTITDTATGSPHVVNLAVNGVASTPAISLSPNGLSFQQTVVGQDSSTMNVNFQNRSGSSITFSSVATTGDFAITSNGCTTVATAADCTVTVKFSPTATGNRTGTLVFTHDGPGGTTSANLAGYGLASNSAVQLSASALAFSDQVIGTASNSQYITLWNNGTVPVTFTAPAITGAFTITSNGCPSSLGPTGYCYIYVNFQPTAAGAASGTLTINSSDPAAPHVVSLTGNGVTPSKTLSFSATSIQFNDQTVGYTASSQTLVAYNTGNSPVTFGTPSITGDFAISYFGCGTVSPGSACYFYVNFTPTATGVRTGSLSFSDDATGAPHSFTLSGNGVTATKTYTLSAGAIAFPDQPVGVASYSQYAVLMNTGTAPLVLSGTTVTGDFNLTYDGCSTQALSTGSGCTVGVQFNPTTTGARTGSLSIASDATAGPALMTLTGQGVTPVKSSRVSATSLTFADIAVGNSSPSQYIYFYNTGNVTLNISSVVFSGDFSTAYNGCSGAIGAGNSCYIYAQFTPTAAGARTGSISISADDTPGVPHVVSLSGNGLTASARLNITPGSLIFPPTVTGNTSAYQLVTVTNPGNTPILISSATIAGSDFSIYSNGCAGATLSVDGYGCNVWVQFTPTTTGPLTGALTFTDNANGSPHTVALSGTGTDPSSAVQLSQNSLTFGNQPTNTTSAPNTVYLVNQGSSVVTTSTVTVVGDFLSSGCDNTYVYPRGSCALAVYFKPTATGTRTGSVTIADNATGSPRTIALSGNGVTPFPISTVTPSNLVFGNQNVGTTSSAQTVVINNSGTANLNVSTIVSSLPDFVVSSGCIGAISPGYSCQFSVSFAPQSTGTITGSLQITDDASGSPRTISLSGNGVAAGPIDTVYPNPATFSAQQVNTTSAAVSIVARNDGNANLQLGAVTATAPFAVSANPCTAPIAPGSSCSISVTFTPTATGLVSGTLSIADNTTSGVKLVGLSGNGIPGPALTITPTNLIFNSQQLNTSSTQALTLYNSGSTLTISNISISAGSFSQTNNCTSLSTGYSCGITVTFAPTTAGTQSATLTITDDAPGSPHTVAISGDAVGQPAVTLSAASVDFGTQSVGSTTAAQAVTMSNTGAGPLAIGSITASGDYAVTSNCGNNLIAGASCTLSITFTPSGAFTRTGAVSIADNAANTPQSIALTGVGNGAVVSLAPASLDFSTQAVATTSAAQTITVSNTGNVPLTISSISSTNPEYAQTNTCAGTLNASATCTVSVTFTPTAAGAQGGTIYVATNVGTPSVSLTGSGTGPVATVSPASLNFGNVNLNTASGTQSVTINSTGTTALTISSISISGDFSQTNNCPASLATGSNCVVQVTFNPILAGTRGGTLVIDDNGSLGGHSISLSGTGLGPAFTLAPGSLSFGTVAVGATATPQSIALTNTGTVILTSIAISASGSDFAQTNNCPSSLAINATCSINVSFTPTATGTRTGSINVSSNANPQSAPLTGAGSGPVVQLNPTSLNFGNQIKTATSAAQTVTLTNGGNVSLNISSITANGDFAQTNNCPSSLGASSFCTISVTFTPSSVGAATGAVTIVDDAGGSPHLVALSGTGILPQEDMVLSGVASPSSVAPGGSSVFTFTVTNNGPSVATGVSFTASLPTNSQTTSVTASNGSCTTGATITCTLSNMPANTSATVTIAVTTSGFAAATTSASISAAEADPTPANNQATATVVVAVADLVTTASGASGSAPTYVVTVTNNGPATASNTGVNCAFTRFGYSGATASQGSCGYEAGTSYCSFGNIASGSSASVTLLVQPPKTGWATIACHATAAEYDPNPVNNSAQISPDGADNTSVGSNVGVQIYDNASGAAARVIFPSVSQSGSTTLSSAAGAVPPAGFRTGAAPRTFDISTTARFSGSPIVALGVPPSQFRHPERVRLFHREGGVWVDRTIAADAVSGTVSAIAGSLSPFALFEPVNHAPVAVAGADRVIAGSTSLGATVTLDAGASTDADGDALTYRWSGPFAEGNGSLLFAKGTVTLPFGTSKLTLAVNDGEADSLPVSVNITVSDFGVSAASPAATLVRGQSISIPVQVEARGGAFDAPVVLGCANLPAGMACQFSPATVQPGTSGATANLTITSTAAVATRRAPAGWPFGSMLFGVAGLVVMSGRRSRRTIVLTIVVLAVLSLTLIGCGGGSISSASSPTPAATPATTVSVTITGTSGGLQHSSTVNVNTR